MSEKNRKFDQISIQSESLRNITKIVSSRNITNVSAIASKFGFKWQRVFVRPTSN